MKQRRIIDRRSKAKFMVDDEYINGMAKLCGWQASIVYFSLCRHANKDQESFPSISLMAEQHGVSRPTIIKGIEALEKRRLIVVGKTRSIKNGKWLNNTYTLLDKCEWAYDPDVESLQVNVDSRAESIIDTSPSQRGLPDQVSVADTKDTHGKGNTYKETHPLKNVSVFPGTISSGQDLLASKNGEVEPSTGSKVNEAMELFRTILPGDFVGNRSAYAKPATRAAVEALLQRYSLDRIKSLIRKYDEGKTDPYRPQVGTVYEFCTVKLAKIEAFVVKDPAGHLWAQRSISTPEQRADSDALIQIIIDRSRESTRKAKEDWIRTHPGEPLTGSRKFTK